MLNPIIFEDRLLDVSVIVYKLSESVLIIGLPVAYIFASICVVEYSEAIPLALMVPLAFVPISEVLALPPLLQPHMSP